MGDSCPPCQVTVKSEVCPTLNPSFHYFIQLTPHLLNMSFLGVIVRNGDSLLHQPYRFLFLVLFCELQPFLNGPGLSIYNIGI